MPKDIYAPPRQDTPISLHPPSAASQFIKLSSSGNLTKSPLQSPYTPDPRDDTDPLSLPVSLRRDAFYNIFETFDVRHAALSELRDRIRRFGDQQSNRQEAPQQLSSPSTNSSSTSVTKRVHLRRSDDDAFLLVFLRSKKFSVDSAFAKYINYCRAHTEHPWLSDIDVHLVERLFASGSYTILPEADDRGRRILSMDMKLLVPFVESLGKTKMRALLVAIFGMLETLMGDARAQVYGVVVIADLDGCRMKTFGYLNVAQYLMSLDLCQNCYPIRANAMYVIREPWYVKGLFNVMRPFMKDAVKDNLLCFGNETHKVHRFISKKVLPRKYGGNLDLNLESNTRFWVSAVSRRLS
eukprot:GFKZ01006836.1.p1 GENE.GFKZ01006836.1~~GFKZ01006836.1.p1  ORF type:complete len:353 (+),score=45.01 GFKZ01006836.1:419-1477(+)